MNKKEILKQLLDKIDSEKMKIEQAYETSKTLTTSAEMKADGKYDTRSIEAGYLAGAQKKRVDELELEGQMISEINLRDFASDEEIAIGAVVSIKYNELVRDYFICSTAGGTILNIEGDTLLVISVFSPLGSQLIGLTEGESFVMETPKEKRSYDILKVS
jgi:transcription elongation GreA/GreB family factor